MTFVLSESDLKRWLHRDLSRLEKVLVILAHIGKPTSVTEVKTTARKGGLTITDKWNVSALLTKSNGAAIRTQNGWELAEQGIEKLSSLGLSGVQTASENIAIELRTELAKINATSTRAFVEEAIKCLENGLHRSAIVMSWLSAVDVLYNHVLTNHLAAFNAEAKRVGNRWKPAKTADDLARMGEADFLDRLATISVIGKSVKTELKECLNRRNGCGHPNSLKLGHHTAAHHIEVLILNVFQPFL